LTGVIDAVGGKFGAEKQVFFRGLDVLLYLTRHDHAPLVLLEAMSHGVVPITTDVGGVPEIVGPGLAGNVIPAALPKGEQARRVAAIVQNYVADPSTLERDRAAARARYLENFTESAFLERLRGILLVEPVGVERSLAQAL
jgi:glycosyltransferase involved in cell wall biosynthesis